MAHGRQSREQPVIDTFVGLTDTLASDYDVHELLQFLVERCSEILDADTAGVLVEAPDGDGLWLAAALTEEIHDIEQAELSAGEGPCVDAYATRQPVIVADLSERVRDWPKVTPRLLDLGMRAGHAFPLRLRNDCIGALNLYRRATGGFSDEDIRLAQAFADVAAIGILQQRTLARSEQRSEQLQHALTSRLVIEQAKGVLAERHDIGPEQAFTALRTYARDRNLKVHVVSAWVVEGVTDPITDR